MQHIASSDGIRVSYEKCGNGPPLVLVHGAFSDHHTNWEFVKPRLERHFTLYALARRGRGDTAATRGHSVADESLDVEALVRAIGEPVFLLGHSYGAQVALAAAARIPQRVRKLVLYEPPWPSLTSKETMARLEGLAGRGEWDTLAQTFFCDTLCVPIEEIRELQATPLWAPIVADAEASMGDLRALGRYDFRADRFDDLRIPVLLQIGTGSRRDLYATDALAARLPDARIEELPGQAHEGMTTAPSMYAQAVSHFLSDQSGRGGSTSGAASSRPIIARAYR